MTKTPDNLVELVQEALEDLKGRDIVSLDVKRITPIADWMVIASGSSDRHVKALAESVLGRAASAGLKPIGVEGEREGEWVLIDLGTVVVHVMLPRARDFYALEKLWRVDDGQDASADG